IGDLVLQHVLEWLHDARYRQRRGRFTAAAEPEREHDSTRHLADQRDVARPGGLVLPGHRAVAVEILPAVARPDIAGARAPGSITLLRIGRGERAADRPLLRP